MRDHGCETYIGVREMLASHYQVCRDEPLATGEVVSEEGRFYPYEQSAEHVQSTFDETVLQVIWNERRLKTELYTCSGRRVRILSPGIWNVEAGPDFKDAVIEIDGVEKRGHVEIHTSVRDWYRHGHDREPLYQDVVLHAVYHRPEGTNICPELPPLLVLEDMMDSTLEDLRGILQRADVYAGRIAPGFCAARWAITDDGAVRNILQAAGLARFRDKAQRFSGSIRRLGAGQAFYEGMFDALGYKSNRESFQQLAREVPLRELQQLRTARDRSAALFGTAGFLPDPSIPQDLNENQLRQARALWHAWWLQGRSYAGITWNRGGVRPANMPEKRLAAGFQVLERMDCDPTMWIKDFTTSQTAPKEFLRNLEEVFSVRSNGDGHLPPVVKGIDTGEVLLGKERVRDLLANVILPWIKAWAGAHNRTELEQMTEECFMLLPCLQGNRVLKEAKHRLFVPPGRASAVVRGAAEQQGMLDIYRRFCCRLNHACYACSLFYRTFAEEKKL